MSPQEDPSHVERGNNPIAPAPMIPPLTPIPGNNPLPRPPLPDPNPET